MAYSFPLFFTFPLQKDMAEWKEKTEERLILLYISKVDFIVPQKADTVGKVLPGLDATPSLGSPAAFVFDRRTTT